MGEGTIERRCIRTERLVLHPSSERDVERAFAIRSNWKVARMLALADFPPDRSALERWFGGHEDEWITGSAYRFAIVLDGVMIGLIDLDGVTGERAELGYWLDSKVWGKAYATEAACAVIQFANEILGLSLIRAGHAEDNSASMAVLTKLGFRETTQEQAFSRSRNEHIIQIGWELSLH